MVFPNVRVRKASKQFDGRPTVQTVSNPMLLLRRDSNASIGMHYEKLYDHANRFLMPRPFPS